MQKNDSKSVGLKIELASKESEKELQNMQGNQRHNNYNKVDFKDHWVNLFTNFCVSLESTTSKWSIQPQDEWFSQ